MVDQKTLREFITWNEPFNTQAKFAKAKRVRGTRYVVVEPGMETGWYSHSLRASQHFENESTARQHAEKHHGIVYPTFFDGIPAPFGSVLIFDPEQGLSIMPVEDFNAEWEDYTPDAEEQAWLKAELERRQAMNVEAMNHKIGAMHRGQRIDFDNAAGPDGLTATDLDPPTDQPTGDHNKLDDIFIETIDPLAPDGPGDPPGRAEPNT